LNGEELLAPHPTPKLGDHLLSAVRDCLFSILAAISGKTGMHHVMVGGTQHPLQQRIPFNIDRYLNRTRER